MYFIKNTANELILKLILSAESLYEGLWFCQVSNDKNLTFEDYNGTELQLIDVSGSTETIKYSGLQIEDLSSKNSYVFDDTLSNFKLEISIVYNTDDKCLIGETFNLSFVRESGETYSIENGNEQKYTCLFKLYSDHISSGQNFYLDFNLLIYEQLQYHFEEVINRVTTDEPAEPVVPDEDYEYLDKNIVLLGIYCRSIDFEKGEYYKPNCLTVTFDPNACDITTRDRNVNANIFKLSKIKHESEATYPSVSMISFDGINAQLQFDIIIDNISKSLYFLWDMVNEDDYMPEPEKQNPSTIMLYFDPVTYNGYKFKINYEDLIKMILDWFKKLSSTNTSISKNSTCTKNINIRKLKTICNKLNIHYSSNINKTLDLILQKINEI